MTQKIDRPGPSVGHQGAVGQLGTVGASPRLAAAFPALLGMACSQGTLTDKKARCGSSAAGVGARGRRALYLLAETEEAAEGSSSNDGAGDKNGQRRAPAGGGTSKGTIPKSHSSTQPHSLDGINQVELPKREAGGASMPMSIDALVSHFADSSGSSLVRSRRAIGVGTTSLLDPPSGLEKRSLVVSVLRLIGLAGLALHLSACAAEIDPTSARQTHVAEDPVALMRIGGVAEASLDWTGADTFYRRASELDPHLASARLAHARMMARQGDLDGALVCLREAHGLHPDDVAITTALGRMLAQAKRPAEALTVFDEGLRADPGSEALLVGKGVALDLLERHAEAQKVYKASLNMDPDNAAARKNLDLSRRMTQ